MRDVEQLTARFNESLREPCRVLLSPSQPDWLDPRYEWVQITRFGAREPEWMRGPCRHLEVVPVESLTGEIVAHLCTTCDAQLP